MFGPSEAYPAPRAGSCFPVTSRTAFADTRLLVLAPVSIRGEETRPMTTTTAPAQGAAFGIITATEHPPTEADWKRIGETTTLAVSYL